MRIPRLWWTGLAGARCAGPRAEPFQCRTPRGTRKAGKWPAAALAALLAATGAAGDEEPPWPPFLPPRASFSAEVGAAVDQVWTQPTFSRTVRGRPARAPLDLYLTLVDTPDVTAAAARFRQFSRDEVRAVAEDWYEAEDREGARGSYRVLRREGPRRVILSWGEHAGSILGTIGGSALTLLALEPREGVVEQTLTAYVRIDNRVAAALARVLVALFGGVVDRRLGEAFASAARVAEWAVEEPEAFCGWLRGAPVPPERRARVLEMLPACGANAARRALAPAPPSP